MTIVNGQVVYYIKICGHQEIMLLPYNLCKTDAELTSVIPYESLVEACCEHYIAEKMTGITDKVCWIDVKPMFIKKVNKNKIDTSVKHTIVLGNDIPKSQEFININQNFTEIKCNTTTVDKLNRADDWYELISVPNAQPIDVEMLRQNVETWLKLNQVFIVLNVLHELVDKPYKDKPTWRKSIRVNIGVQQSNLRIYASIQRVAHKPTPVINRYIRIYINKMKHTLYSAMSVCGIKEIYINQTKLYDYLMITRDFDLLGVGLNNIRFKTCKSKSIKEAIDTTVKSYNASKMVRIDSVTLSSFIQTIKYAYKQQINIYQHARIKDELLIQRLLDCKRVLLVRKQSFTDDLTVVVDNSDNLLTNLEVLFGKDIALLEAITNIK